MKNADKGHISHKILSGYTSSKKICKIRSMYKTLFTNLVTNHEIQYNILKIMAFPLKGKNHGFFIVGRTILL